MSNEENIVKEENKTIRFPIERAEPPKEDKTLFHCKACGHHITESMEKDVKNEKKGTYKEWVDEDYWRKYGEGGKNRWVDKE